ncbi:MAG TPA: class I SAM-dependent methyltransferase [Anaerolineae bacterium]|nr:class I SAM-dependent methyltransferase [Anaerolineae bacterium]HQK14081.1 class I SAM-dependent methyltransferase [Anaerolineae bacterium]
MNKPSSGSVPSILYNEQYFLHVCEGYQEFLSSEGEYLSQRLREALSVAGIAPGMAVLDVGCGRGEILRQTTRMGARAFGIDYAKAAVRLSQKITTQERHQEHPIGVYQASALYLPFAPNTFDRVLMFDIVEHLYPAELALALDEARRVLKPGGRIIVHTAPNAWYDRFAYPVVRLVRILMGQGQRYPKNPREIIPENVHVHVNEQSMFSLARNLRRSDFRDVKAWLSTPPQHRQENLIFRMARWILFNVPPWSWFFEREVFAVGEK